MHWKVEGGGEVGQERTLPRDLTLPLPLPLPNSTFRGKVVPAALWATGLIMKGELYETIIWNHKESDTTEQLSLLPEVTVFFPFLLCVLEACQ